MGYLGTFGTRIYPDESAKGDATLPKTVSIDLNGLPEGQYMGEFFVRTGMTNAERLKHGVLCCMTLRITAPGLERDVRLTGKDFVEYLEIGPFPVDKATSVRVEFTLEGDLKERLATTGKLPLPVEMEYFRVWRDPTKGAQP
jgi:hypothetical protein